MVRAAAAALGLLIVGHCAAALATSADPSVDRSEFHFVLSFPLGAVNGFASHPAGPSEDGCLDVSSQPYTSTIFGLGISLGLLYEAEWYGIGAQVSGLLGPGGASAFGDVHVLAYLSPTSTSPFIGAGLGFVANQAFFLCFPPNPPPNGYGATSEFELGIELGRLSQDHLRVQLSVELMLPFFNDEDGSYPVGALFNTRVAF